LFIRRYEWSKDVHVQEAVARHWGLLTFLVGALLVYAAFHPSVRGPVMVVAVIEKVALGLGIFGTSLRTHPAAAAAAAGDSLIALIYVLYLAGFYLRRSHPGEQNCLRKT
jgi:hypothetical protein